MNNNFHVPHWGWWTSILIGLGLTAWIGFSSSGFALWQEWITTAIPQSVFQWTFWLAMLAHVGEGLYAVHLARKANRPHVLLWGLQTFVLGYPSLTLLRQQTGER